jgi:hypothetical protein
MQFASGNTRGIDMDDRVYWYNPIGIDSNWVAFEIPAERSNRVMDIYRRGRSDSESGVGLIMDDGNTGKVHRDALRYFVDCCINGGCLCDMSIALAIYHNNRPSQKRARAINKRRSS